MVPRSRFFWLGRRCISGLVVGLVRRGLLRLRVSRCRRIWLRLVPGWFRMSRRRGLLGQQNDRLNSMASTERDRAQRQERCPYCGRPFHAVCTEFADITRGCSAEASPELLSTQRGKR